jgi:Uma2 family endonuclease
MSQVIAESVSRGAHLMLRLRPAVELTDEQFFALCQINREFKLERTAQGDLIIMTPTGWETGARNSEINRQLGNWAKEDGRGVATDSSTGYKLPNGAERSPDAAWVSRARLAQLTAEQKRKFLPLCPDFVIELRSPTDELTQIQSKMEEYIANGARLGWLIDPEARWVHVYRPGRRAEILEAIEEISADPELEGFVLNLREIWAPNI